MAKVAVYTEPVTGQLHVVVPIEGARLASSAVVNGTTVFTIQPIRAEDLFGLWRPEYSALVEWAETEDEFVDRIARTVAPVGVTTHVIDRSILPESREEHDRNAWAFDGKAITIDPVRRAASVARADERRRAEATRLRTILDDRS